MKIGIVTVHDSNNYGSFLQAFALQEVLHEFGHEVFFVRTRDKKFVKKTFIPRLFRKKNIRHPIRFFHNWKTGVCKWKAFTKDQTLFKEIDRMELEAMDLVILGSDEIWNIQVKSFQNGLFFGEGVHNAIAYAVSVGRAEYQDFKNNPFYAEAMKTIGHIMVRDSRTKDIVEKVCGFTPKVVCDPTFLIDKELFTRNKHAEDHFRDGRFLLIYSYSLGKDMEEKIKKLAESKKLKIVSACFYYNWADHNMMVGPLEFCSLMQKADFVFTTTFHGTVFSILNEKQFVCIPASIKTNDLLEKLGLEERIIEENASIERIAGKMESELTDYASVNGKIKQIRAESLELLKESIENTVKANERKNNM